MWLLLPGITMGTAEKTVLARLNRSMWNAASIGRKSGVMPELRGI